MAGINCSLYVAYYKDIDKNISITGSTKGSNEDEEKSFRQEDEDEEEAKVDAISDDKMNVFKGGVEKKQVMV